MFGHAFYPETTQDSHQVKDPSRKFEAAFRGQPAKTQRGSGRIYTSPRSVVEGFGLSQGAEQALAGWVKSELLRSENELDFRRGLVNRLLESRYEPTLRRAIMDRAMSLYQSSSPERRPRFTARRQLLPESYSNKVPKNLIPQDVSQIPPMKKGSQRGGNYHRRVAKPEGGYKYIYSEVDDEPSGHDAKKIHLGKRVKRIIDKAGPDGCPAELLKELAATHGASVIAELVHEHGDFEICAGKVKYLGKARAVTHRVSFGVPSQGPSSALSGEMIKGLKVAPGGAGGAGGGSEGSPPGTKKVWNNKIVEKQPDGKWKTISHVAGFEGERVPGKMPKPGADREAAAQDKDSSKPAAKPNPSEMSRQEADKMIVQLREKKS